MKKLLGITILVILTSLLIDSMAYARGDDCGKPPKPECGDDMITVEEAQWVDGTESCPALTFEASREVVDAPAYTEHRHWVDTTYVCPSNIEAYTSHSHQDCRWEEKIHGKWHYADKIVDVPGDWGDWSEGTCKWWDFYCEERTVPAVTHTETFGPITVQYDKSSDPNHCHRPTGASLGVPSWAMSDFNKLPELLDKIVTDGYWTDPVCEPIPVGESCARCSNVTEGTFVEWYDRDGGCDDDWYNERVEYPNDERCGYVPPVICEDEAASNYGEEGECEFDVVIPGCTDETASNYNSDANVDDGTCIPREECIWEYVRTQCVDWMNNPPGTMRHECYTYSTDGYLPRYPDVANRVCTLCVDGELLEFQADYRIGCGDVEQNSCTGEIRFFYPGWLHEWVNIWNDKAPCVTDDCG